MSDETRRITVTGTGELAVAPDVMGVDIGVSVRSDTIAEASSTARSLAGDLIATLTGSGVATDDIVTTNYSISPEYDHRDGSQRLLGFRVSNELHITVRDVSAAGDLIDRAVTAVGDAATVNQVVFRVEDDTAAKTRARESAWADALSKAEHLAALSGRSLGAVVSITEVSGRAPGPRPLARMAAMADSTPIEAGTTRVAVTLEVTFGLE